LKQTLKQQALVSGHFWRVVSGLVSDFVSNPFQLPLALDPKVKGTLGVIAWHKFLALTPVYSSRGRPYSTMVDRVGLGHVPVEHANTHTLFEGEPLVL
jgi:hypothetical protein